jgi:hypothetical protein
VTRTALTATQNDYVETLNKVFINPNLMHSASYEIKHKYQHLLDSTYLTHNVQINVQCVNTSNSFTINVPNNSPT